MNNYVRDQINYSSVLSIEQMGYRIKSDIEMQSMSQHIYIAF